MTQNSYLREFCGQVSQIVLLDDLTVSRPKTTVWAKMSQNSLLREFCVQVSQIVFLAYLTVLLLIKNKILNSWSCVRNYQKTCS